MRDGIDIQTLVLLSGGIDSSATLHYFLRQGYKVTALFVDYGQLARTEEGRAALKVTSFYGVAFRTIKVKGLTNATEGFIRGRNAFLLYTALMAFEGPSGLVSFGVHSSTTYPDCSRVFVDQIQTVYDLYSNGAIKIHAPFIDWTKAEIVEYCIENKLPLNFTYSCEMGGNSPCKKCLSCRDLEVLGVTR